MTEQKKLKAALYVRVSTEDQSTEGQLIQLREWARRGGHEVYKEYSDHAISGTKVSRPAFDEMLADMRRYKFNAISVVKLDRLGRSLKHILSLFDEFNAKGVAVICTTQPIDTSANNPLGKVVLALLGAFAELERDLISERTKAGLAAKRKKLEEQGKSWKFRGKDKRPRLRGGFRPRLKYPKNKLQTDAPQSDKKEATE
jgi:DNA invertase Pin-like site-specific DNA recombinase